MGACCEAQKKRPSVKHDNNQHLRSESDDGKSHSSAFSYDEPEVGADELTPAPDNDSGRQSPAAVSQERED